MCGARFVLRGAPAPPSDPSWNAGPEGCVSTTKQSSLEGKNIAWSGPVILGLYVLLSESDFDPHPQPQNSLVRISVCNQLSQMVILTKKNLSSGQELLPLQFPGLSLP